jgi:hypothetical protein
LTSTVFFHPHELFCRVLFDNAGLLQQKNEGGGAAVHDRRFLGIDVDENVVDAKAGQCRHQVLNGCHAHIVFHQRRREPGIVDQIRRHFELRHLRQVNTAEHDAGVDRRRAQVEGHAVAAVQAYSAGLDRLFEGSLFDHAGATML